MITAAPAQSEERVVLQNVSWRLYEQLLQELGESRAVRLTYDQGTLELMSPLLPHESSKCSLDRLIAVLAEELALNFRSVGSLTCKREDLQRGVEPDSAYYLQNEPLIRQNAQIQLPNDPPPDLVVEIEYSSAALDKLPIYAALGVPELWRYDGRSLLIYALVGGVYAETDLSPTFATIPVKQIPSFLQLAATVGEIEMVKQFRAWVREQQ
ncbi:MAG: Uma2 family endonuclease [Elainellaceae cyanobacterium]